MDRLSALERRYSFNMTQGNHVAESVQHNGSSFSWGTSMSPKHRSYSNLCVNNAPIDGYIKTKNMKIDARIAADVQSRGLASRIVKYHDCGTRLSRSISAHNLYSKPGQFPSVTLKKTLLPYRATRQELSMIRIPPPEKSSFYGSTVSSLSRSSSVIGLQTKHNEDLSRENRPIIHPPPTESDMAPTRSVLDVLKEISRKRINSEDLSVEENSKKYCNRPGNDVADTNNKTTSAQNFVASSSSCQRFKRQRDCPTPQKGVQLSETKTSPEQCKKRVCNYNNDITSSLSSSVKSKRALVSHNLKQNMPTNLESSEKQKTKEKNYDKNNIDKRFENLEYTSRKVNEIKSVTPNLVNHCAQEHIDVGEVVSKQTILEPYHNSNQKLTNFIPTTNKPRLTLFNKKYDEIESTGAIASCKILSNNTNDYIVDCEGIPFVKPKNITSRNSFRNPIMERTKKSKLALMLSGLKGELYKNTEADKLDSSNEEHRTETFKNQNINNNTKAVLNLTNTIPSSIAATFSKNVETRDPKNLLSLSSNAKNELNIDQIKPTDGIKNTESQSNSNVSLSTGFSVAAANVDLPLLIPSTASNISKTVTKPILSLSTNKMLDSNQSASSWCSDEIKNKLSPNIQPSTKNNLLQFPTVCTTFTTLTSNTNTPTNTVTPFSASKVINQEPKGDTKLRDFSFCVPSTASPTATISSVQPMAASTKSAVTAATTDAVTFNLSVTPTSLINPPSFTSSGGVSFTFDRNLTTTSASTFATNTHSTIKTPLSTSFPFSSNTKTQNSVSNSQNNQENSNQTGNNTRNLNSSVIFGPQCLKTQSPVETAFNFCNANNGSKNTFNSPNTATKTFCAGANNDSALCSSNGTNNKSAHFNIGTKLAVIPTSNTNNATPAIGVFSFSAAESKCMENGSLAFRNNFTDKTKTLTNTFCNSPNTNSQFGLPTNKLDNSVKKQSEITSSNGFFFGPSTTSSTFKFTAGNSSENVVTTANSISSGFAFNSAIAKPNIISTNKIFSFGSPQPTQQNQIHSIPPSNTDSINVFGLGGSTKTVSMPAFNFNPGNSTNLNSNAPTVSNIFSPSPNITTGPGDRPIRRATRRLQK